MKRKIMIILSVMLIAVLSLSLFACGGDKDEVGEVNPFIESIGEAPTIDLGSRVVDSSQITLSETPSTELSVLESAVYLFDIANYNIKNVEYWNSIAYGSGTASIGGGISGTMEVRDIYVKEGKKSYMETYGRIVETNEQGKSLLKMMRGILDYGKLRYTEDGKEIYYISGKSETLDANSIANFLSGEKTINVEKTDKKSKIKYESAQEYKIEHHVRSSIFEIDNADIKSEYLEEATITRDAEQGLYKVTMIVDPKSEALEMGRQSLRKSASSKDLDYVYQTIIFEVWDCGVLRSYCTENSWQATIVVLSGASENKYFRYFGYDKTKANLTKMPTADELDWLSSCNPKK